MANETPTQIAKLSQRRQRWFKRLIERLETEYGGGKRAFAEAIGLSAKAVRDWKDGMDPMKISTTRWEEIASMDRRPVSTENLIDLIDPLPPKSKKAIALMIEGNIFSGPNAYTEDEEVEESQKEKFLSLLRQIAHNATVIDSVIRNNDSFDLLFTEIVFELADLNEFRRSLRQALDLAYSLGIDVESLAQGIASSKERWQQIVGEAGRSPVDRPTPDEIDRLHLQLELLNPQGEVYTALELKRLCGWVNGDTKSPAVTQG